MIKFSTFVNRLVLPLFVSSAAMSSTSSRSLEAFPSSIQEFGYEFNKEGKLRQLDPLTREITEEPFVFNVSADPKYNQARYEALGELITPYVYDLLLNDTGLKKLPVPVGQSPSSFIFASDDALSNPYKLMILIHGSGVVRAGQWARSLIINDSLQSGTQIPYIKKAKALGYGVFVFNTNDNTVLVDGKVVPIKGSSNPTEHANSVWNDYVKSAKAKHIVVVAHSFGGVCTVELASSHFGDFSSRVVAVALTDSVHQFRSRNLDLDVRKYLRSVGRNWVSSSKLLDEVIEDDVQDEIISVSAGHKKHEMTSWSCINSLFDFLEDKVRAKNNTVVVAQD